MKKKIIGLVLVICIFIVGFLIVDKLKTNDKQKEIIEFNEKIMAAAEVYIQGHLEDYDNFKNVGDSITLTVEEIIESGALKKDIDNPTDKEFSEIKIRLTFESESVINYKVLD